LRRIYNKLRHLAMMTAKDNAPEVRAGKTKGHSGEVLRAFLKLGWISFGGPVAHLSYFHEEFVARRRWLDDSAFGDLVALCQFLPGPASSQLVFALGMRRAGLMGALTASFCFTTPSAVLMILFAYGISALGDLQHAGWMHGLKLAAVAVVAQAVWNMGRRLCPDQARLTLCFGAAALALIRPGAIGQIGAIFVGALIGWWIYRREFVANSTPARLPLRAHWIAGACLAAFSTLLALLPVAAAATHAPLVAMFDSFYRGGRWFSAEATWCFRCSGRKSCRRAG
jgi:chromate transporter